jgi:D-tyrosyl-tRNA(Tyr) deacylase
MRLIIQAVERATVIVFDTSAEGAKSKAENNIGKGIVIYFGVHVTDVMSQVENYKLKIDKLVGKIGNMRWLKNPEGRLDATLTDIGWEILVISNFTLYASNEKGMKMSFSQSAAAIDAKPVYDYFVEQLRAAGWKVETGEFAAMMEVHAITLGPINYVWDT